MANKDYHTVKSNEYIDFGKFSISMNWNPFNADLLNYQTRLMRKLNKLSEPVNQLKNYDALHVLNLVHCIVLQNESNYIKKQNFTVITSIYGKKLLVKVFYNSVTPIANITVNQNESPVIHN